MDLMFTAWRYGYQPLILVFSWDDLNVDRLLRSLGGGGGGKGGEKNFFCF